MALSLRSSLSSTRSAKDNEETSLQLAAAPVRHQLPSRQRLPRENWEQGINLPKMEAES